MAIRAVEGVSSAGAAASQATPGGTSFEKILETKRSSASSFLELPQTFVSMSQRILAGQSLSLPQMLAFQSQAHQINLRVELCAKAADGLLTSVRKLQQQQ
jgi:hypothetical protein